MPRHGRDGVIRPPCTFTERNALTLSTAMLEPPFAETAGEAASAYDEALMDLSVTLAHRIRSFVASIEGYTDLLADTLGTAEQREIALRILEGAARIEHILADLQLFGKPIEPVATPLRVAEVVAEIERFLDEKEASLFRLELEAGEDEAVLADPALLNQALLILVRNAFEATDYAGRVVLNVKPSEVPAQLQFDLWNAGAIDVEDAAARVFVPFFTTKAQNLGIGLPVARRIAEAHGGALQLDSSSESGGTLFSLRIPLCTSEFASILQL